MSSAVFFRAAQRLARRAKTLPVMPPFAARAFGSQRDISGYNSKVLAVLGAQWGDEGKGKLVDILAKRFDIIGRFNGGANAGHTLVVNGKKFAFHLLPCGMLYPGKLNVIGNGVVVHVPTLFKELKNLDDAGVDYKGALKISNRAHLLFDFHLLIDANQEAALKESSIGTTKKGIGPAYASKITRNGVRVGDLVNFTLFRERYHALLTALRTQYPFLNDYDPKEELERFQKYRDRLIDFLFDSVYSLDAALKAGKSILAEGANAALLDVDYGTYPFVTSSSTTAGGVATGLGIAPSRIDSTIGVVKAYTTRVGAGPFPTELSNEIGEKIRKDGHEFGTTTGRPRRCGWLDIPVVHYSHILNNFNSINITKLDVLSSHKDLKIGTHYKLNGQILPPGVMPSTLQELANVEVVYETLPGWQSDISKITSFEKLPANAQAYLKRVEELLQIPISWIGTGPGRTEMATKGFTAE